MSLLTKILGDPNEKVLKEIKPIVGEINKLEEKFKGFSDGELKEKIEDFKKLLQEKDEDNIKNNYTPSISPLAKGEDDSKKGWNKPASAKATADKQKEILDKILPEIFAIVREAASRKLKQRHYDEQLMGGVVLHRGQIAEMKTGEGKTLTAALPVCLNALAGRGVHVVTPNDYLSRVGGGWMAPVYYALGLTVGVITHDFAGIYDPDYVSSEKHGNDERLRHWKPVERKEAYQADITYGTNNEFGFDYLRDNMAPSLEKMVQRGLHYSIVDEIDSILIDEARTPLIISAPAAESSDYGKYAQLVTQLEENEDYNIDEKMKATTLTEAGLNKMEKLLGVKNIYTEGGVREVNHIEQALKAYALFQKDKDYVVSSQGGSVSGGKDGEIIIVDEFTGRLMPGRRYSEGLHQAIEAKEGVEVKRESRTLATITFQNYFRMYTKLAGMTGTAKTEEEEFGQIYGLATVIIPTHKQKIRQDETDLIYSTEAGKLKALVADIKERNKKGQPILIGTISIEKNEVLGEMLDRAGVPVQMLNAKNHEKEAQIITQAGKPGAVTVATNMAGRGVDIILGGSNASAEEVAKVKQLGGLHVIGTERHESRRIDNQLRGRAGRQGDQGSSQFYLSMEDDLMRIFGGDRMKSIMSTLKVPEDMPVENRIIAKSIESAQKKVEENNFDIRKHLVEFDDVINKHRASVYKRRREILENNEYQDVILDMVAEEVSMVINFHTEGEDISQWNIKEIKETIKTIFSVSDNFQDELKKLLKLKNVAEARQKIIDYIIKLSQEAYSELAKALEGLIQEDSEKDIKPINEITKQILVRSIDTIWTEHLDVMSQMRQGIGLRGYGQRDPLLEYKKESYSLFQQLNNLIRKQVVYSIFKVGDVSQFVAPNLMQQARNFMAPTGNNSSFSQFKQDGNQTAKQADTATQKMKDTEGNKVGRNDPCPCGSGKKYKKCHGNQS